MRQIVLSKRAANKLKQLLNYLEENWSRKVKQDFIKHLDKNLENIQRFPESYEHSYIKRELYRCVVTKQVSIFYQFDDKNINVVSIFDTRMNPARLKDETDT